MDGALHAALSGRPCRGTPDLRRPARAFPAPALHRPSGAVRRRTLHEALFSGRQAGRRVDPGGVRGAGGAPGEGAAVVAETLCSGAPGQGLQARGRPADPAEARRIRARAGRDAEDVRGGSGDRLRYPPRRAAGHGAQSAPHRRPAAARSPGQRVFHGRADGQKPAGSQPQAHERGRRVRPLRARFRPRRRPDAVRHVSPLYGRRAHHPRHRPVGAHRTGRTGRGTSAVAQADPEDRVAPGAVCGRAAARHRQGPGRRPFHHRCRDRRPAMPPAGPDAGRNRPGRLAGALSPVDEPFRLQARPGRPQNHPRLRRDRAEPGTAEAAGHPDRGRHPRGRPRRVERLEGPAAARAV